MNADRKSWTTGCASTQVVELRKDVRMGTDNMGTGRPERAASPAPRLSINALTPVETEEAVETPASPRRV